MQSLQIPVPEGARDVSALLVSPEDALCLVVLGHGAGAGMRHPFMEWLAAGLARLRVASLRYRFPYREAGRRAPDRAPLLKATVRAAVAAGAAASGGLPLFAGGKSMGGRMTSSAAADAALDGVQGLVFFGFPLHPTGRPGTDRAAHLGGLSMPMLFLQGARDPLADLDLMAPLVAGLGPRASLHVVEGGDHSFEVLKRSGRTVEEAWGEVVAVAADWMISRA